VLSHERRLHHLLDLRPVREAVDAELTDAGLEIPEEHIALVLMALHHLHLLSPVPGPVEDWRRLVREAGAEALRSVVERTQAHTRTGAEAQSRPKKRP